MLKTVGLSIGGGLLGVALGLGIWHLYQDHVIFHQIVDSIIAQQQAQQHKP